MHPQSIKFPTTVKQAKENVLKYHFQYIKTTANKIYAIADKVANGYYIFPQYGIGDYKYIPMDQVKLLII